MFVLTQAPLCVGKMAPDFAHLAFWEEDVVWRHLNEWWLVLLQLTFGFGFDLHLKCLASVCNDSKFVLMINRKLLALTCPFLCVLAGQKETLRSL